MNTKEQVIIDFLILDKTQNMLLIQKRSEGRKLFPGRWEITGGHLEAGETPDQCIRRELGEELGMTLDRILGKVHSFYWEGDQDTRNDVYLIEASGDIRLEADKASEARWVDADEAALLLGDGEETNGLYEATQKAFIEIEKGKKMSLSKPNSFDYEKEFEGFFNEMAEEARKIALKYFRSNLVVSDKDDKSPVTLADKEIEAKLRDMILKKYPTHGIVGEEYGKENETAEFVWVIDPIDGTKAFATGKPLFGTIIGLVHSNRPTVGLIDQAFTKERWFGVSDLFCRYNNQLTKVAPPRPLEGARFYTAAPEMFHGDVFEDFETLRKSTKWALYGCDCYAYGLLAIGSVDLVIEQYLGLHDIMGLIPVIKGAGGHVSDWNGKEIGLDSDGKIIAASCKPLAESALRILNRKKMVPSL